MNRITKRFNEATTEERFEFLCELDKRYCGYPQNSNDTGNGLLIVYRSYMRKIWQIKNQNEIKRSLKEG
uniref:Uncharacterized protein n=1 Tax=viral metagenome TaxID=1070528 RepID=A0A6H1ZAK5_9ZZZZ